MKGATIRDTAFLASAGAAEFSFDASTNGGFQGTVGQSTHTFSHTIGSGSSRLLIVAVSSEGGGGDAALDVSGVTYNGVAMTAVSGAVVDQTESGVHERASLWYMLDASLPTAGSYNVVITMNQALAAVGGFGGAAISVFGAKQQAREAVATSGTNSDATSWSTNITTVSSNAIVFDAIAGGISGSGTATATDQVERVDQSGGGGGQWLAGSTRVKASPGTTTMSWNFSVTQNRWGHVLAAFEPA